MSNYLTQCITKRLDIYLKDHSLIVFGILHEAIRTYRDQHSGFKFTLKKLLDIPTKHGELEPSVTCDRMISPRKSVVLAFMAQDDDLIRLMPFFKPMVGQVCTNESTTDCFATRDASIGSDELDKWILQWISTSKRILRELHSIEICDPKPSLQLIGMMRNQLSDLTQQMHSGSRLETTDGVVFLSAMTLILREVSITTSEAVVTLHYHLSYPKNSFSKVRQVFQHEEIN